MVIHSSIHRNRNRNQHQNPPPLPYPSLPWDFLRTSKNISYIPWYHFIHIHPHHLSFLPISSGTLVLVLPSLPHWLLELHLWDYLFSFTVYVKLILLSSSQILSQIITKKVGFWLSVPYNWLFLIYFPLHQGLIDAADRAGSSSENHTYLRNPIWWAGMVTSTSFYCLITATLPPPWTHPCFWTDYSGDWRRFVLTCTSTVCVNYSRAVHFANLCLVSCQLTYMFHAGWLVANFAAYTFAPPILVTPLGALSVLIGYAARPLG